MYTIGRYTLLFLIYSFIGALAETLFRWLLEGQVYGIHGFLNLPVMPIYGIGALLIVVLLAPRIKRPVPLFVASVVLTTVLEYAGHWLIETLFGFRLWDYSAKPFDIEGRVSLDNSIGFGAAALLLVHVVHPFVWKQLSHLSKRRTLIVAAVVIVVFGIDFILSVMRYAGYS